jgi:hypothetical protein
MHTDKGQTQAVQNLQEQQEQHQQSTMATASAVVGNGGHRRERKNSSNSTISTGGNNYKKEPFETEQRTVSFNSDDPQSKAMMIMSNNTTSTLSGPLKTPAVGLVPQSTFGSKGTTPATNATATTAATIAPSTIEHDHHKDPSYTIQPHRKAWLDNRSLAHEPTYLQEHSMAPTDMYKGRCTQNPVQEPNTQATTVVTAITNNTRTNPEDTYDRLMTVVIAPPMDRWKLLKTKRWHSPEFSCRKVKHTYRQYDRFYLYRIKAKTILATLEETKQIHEICIPHMTLETLKLVNAAPDLVESNKDQRPKFRQHYMITITRKKIYRKTYAIGTLSPENHKTVNQSTKHQNTTTKNHWIQTTRGERDLPTSHPPYLLPLPWQHHAWIAPAHRKALRQQPF